MAKRKAARAARPRSGQAKKRKVSGGKTAGRRRAAAKKTVSRKKTASRRKTASTRRPAAKATKRARKPARKPVVKARAAKPAAPSRPAVSAAKSAKPARASRPQSPRPAAKAASRSVPVMRKAPGLDRERRIARDDDDIIQSTPPSSLDLDRSASAVRTGRRALKDRYDQHTETSPAMTAGDVDADWESAYSVRQPDA